MNNLVKVIALVAGIFVAGGLIGWLATESSPAGGPVNPPVETSPAHPATTNPPAEAAPVALPRPRPTFMASNYGALTKVSDQTQTAVAVSVDTNLVTDWEEKLDDVLGGRQSETAKARQLLGLFPRLPPDGQEEVAEHLSNLVSDEDYPLLSQHLTNSALPEAVLDVLLTDALNRPNELKLPALLGVARDSRNPKASEAKDLLELFLEEDYGDDWDAWQQNLTKWLKDHPE